MDKLINESKKRPRIAKLAITKIVKLFPLNMKYEPALWKGQLYRKSPYLGASFCVINKFIVFGFGHISKYPVVYIRWWYSFIKQRYGHFVYCVYIVREWGTIQAWCLNVYIIKIFHLSSLLQKMLFNKSQL